MTATPELVLVDRSSTLITITINRPESRNCLTADTINALISAFKSISGQPSARCVLLCSAGTEAFCPGADLSELLNADSPDSRRAFFGSIATLIETIHRCPVPVVARVHGFALAGGCGLAAACDITIASDDAVFGLPEVRIGLAPLVVMAPISRVVGHKALSQLVLTGERISAVRALEIGLVNRIVPPVLLNAEALKLCQDIMQQGAAALRAAKAAMLDSSERDYLLSLHELADRSALLSLGLEAKEGMQAFIEKRQPSWRI